MVKKSLFQTFSRTVCKHIDKTVNKNNPLAGLRENRKTKHINSYSKKINRSLKQEKSIPQFEEA